MHHFALITLILLVSVYLIVGGFIFWALESDREIQHEAARVNFNLTSLLTDFTDVFDSVPLENLTKFVNGLLEIERAGLLKEKKSSNWDVHGSLFFAMTVVTTIGYGNVAPETTGGQLFSCFFAIIGIPVTMVLLIGIGERFKNVTVWINCRLCPERFRDNKLTDTFTITVVGMILFLLIPAAIFTSLEEWGYGAALYYSIITTTTIGFGDYVAAWSCFGSACWVYRISVGIWIFLGLAWLAGVIGTLEDVLQMLIEKFVAKCKRKDAEDKAEEEREGREKIESSAKVVKVFPSVKTSHV